ncbi:hypothetical protein GCM10009804_69540 [Kribbella hippodromi]|uniref:Uncharacterized protein n=1 Tax=Kribbella hippodromi TaxID=434347 RepID=A0ABP4QCR4_9ACTN
MTTRALLFERAFFDLQAYWVDRVVELAHIDRLTAWHDWTSMSALVDSDGWRAIDAAVHHGDPAKAAHQSWLDLRASLGTSSHGCFWYEVEDDGHQIRLHFANREGPGALSSTRHAARRAELASALNEARRVAPQADRLRGGSWLYNLPGYRAMFPPTFLAGAIEADTRREVGELALWGQFVRGDGELYQPRTGEFVQACENATKVGDLITAFPLRKLNVVGSLDDVLSWAGARCR